MSGVAARLPVGAGSARPGTGPGRRPRLAPPRARPRRSASFMRPSGDGRRPSGPRSLPHSQTTPRRDREAGEDRRPPTSPPRRVRRREAQAMSQPTIRANQVAEHGTDDQQGGGESGAGGCSSSPDPRRRRGGRRTGTASSTGSTGAVRGRHQAVRVPGAEHLRPRAARQPCPRGVSSSGRRRPQQLRDLHAAHEARHARRRRRRDCRPPATSRAASCRHRVRPVPARVGTGGGHGRRRRGRTRGRPSAGTGVGARSRRRTPVAAVAVDPPADSRSRWTGTAAWRDHGRARAGTGGGRPWPRRSPPRPGLPRREMMRRTAAGESTTAFARRRSISSRSPATRRIRADTTASCLLLRHVAGRGSA
ncbi:hypothetical protein SALBM217S_01392 [Streptomyces griseoloalbus]